MKVRLFHTLRELKDLYHRHPQYWLFVQAQQLLIMATPNLASICGFMFGNLKIDYFPTVLVADLPFPIIPIVRFNVPITVEKAADHNTSSHCMKMMLK